MSVTLTLANATATANIVNVQLHGGASYVLTPSNPLSLTGSFTFTGLSVTAHTVGFTVAPQAALGGTIVLPVAAGTADPKAGPPSILVSNVNVDTVSVTWPTDDGQVTQLMTPGTPMTLNGLIFDK